MSLVTLKANKNLPGRGVGWVVGVHVHRLSPRERVGEWRVEPTVPYRRCVHVTRVTGSPHSHSTCPGVRGPVRASGLVDTSVDQSQRVYGGEDGVRVTRKGGVRFLKLNQT